MESRCEQLCDDETFWDWGRETAIGVGNQSGKCNLANRTNKPTGRPQPGNRAIIPTWRPSLCDQPGNNSNRAEIVTKIVAVRAVNLSIGPFCTEFRCEQLCDDDIFWIGVNFLHFFRISKRFSEPRTKKAYQKPES